MESNRVEICKSLKQWFDVFFKANCLSADQRELYHLNDLSDGVAIAISLRKFAPDYFTRESYDGFYMLYLFTCYLHRLTNLQYFTCRIMAFEN